MRLVFGSDERNKLTDSVLDYLKSLGHRLVLMGALGSGGSDRWVEIGKEAALMVAEGKVESGILFCSYGTGICMAANRINGARDAICRNSQIARLARKWDNANILCMALISTKEDEAKEIIDTFLSAPFDEEGFNEAYKLDE